MLRHTFGRQSIAAGADLVTIQKQMGHKNIGTTRIYTELSNTEQHKRHQETSPLKGLKLNFHQGGAEPAPQDAPDLDHNRCVKCSDRGDGKCFFCGLPIQEGGDDGK